MFVERVERMSLHTAQANSKAVVIGTGISGLLAGRILADHFEEVVLVERNPSIGGHMAQLDKTFPTLDCSACILSLPPRRSIP